MIFLTGMTGVGKSEVGARLAVRLGLSFVDLDAKVSRATGRKIPQIFAEEGEAAFREQEALALRRVIRTPHAVIALGAGALDRQTSFELVHSSGVLVYLRAPINVLASRLFSGLHGRPMLAGAETVEHLEHRLLDMLSHREPRYLTAQIIVDLDEQTSIEDTVDRLCQVLKSLP